MSKSKFEKEHPADSVSYSDDKYYVWKNFCGDCKKIYYFNYPKDSAWYEVKDYFRCSCGSGNLKRINY